MAVGYIIDRLDHANIVNKCVVIRIQMYQKIRALIRT